MNKKLTVLLLCLIVSSSNAAPQNPVTHKHGSRSHTHPLPKTGINHNHDNALIGKRHAHIGKNTSYKKHEEFKENIYLILESANIRSTEDVLVYWGSYDWKNNLVYDDDGKSEEISKKYKPLNTDKCKHFKETVKQKIQLDVPKSFNKYASNHAYEIFNDVLIKRNQDLKKYRVSIKQYADIFLWQKIWDQPAICACNLTSNISKFCRTNGYPP